MHGKFIHAYIQNFEALEKYLKKHYPKGLTWNESGIDALKALEQVKGTCPRWS